MTRTSGEIDRKISCDDFYQQPWEGLDEGGSLNICLGEGWMGEEV